MSEIALFHSALGVRPGVTDASKTDEYQPAEAEEFWPRVLDFIERGVKR